MAPSAESAHRHTRPHTGESRVFHFDTRWQVPAPRARVWAVISRIDTWPQWWPGIHKAQLNPAGDTAAVTVSSPLGYQLRFYLHLLDADEPDSVRIRATGDLRGSGELNLTQQAGHTSLQFQWCVVSPRRLVRFLAPLAGPAHGWVMSTGQTGLTARLSETD